MNNSGHEFKQSAHGAAQAIDTTAEQIQVKREAASGPDRRRARRTEERKARRENQRAVQTGTFKRVEQDYLQRIVDRAPAKAFPEKTLSADWVNPRGGLFA